MAQQRTLYLDGYTLSPSEVVEIGYNPNIKVDLTEEAWQAVRDARAVVDKVLNRKQIAYGINTGFGNFANVLIQPDELSLLQLNLIRSHAAGVGEPLSPPQTRMLLLLRINVLAKGHSGIRPETLHSLLAALNANCLPYVPSKGTVGASGDLAPLSHLALGMLGEGRMWDPELQTFQPAATVLSKFGLEPITLSAKEGLALINGTQLITSIGSEAVVRARNIARQADVIAAMTLEALKGSVRPFHPSIHQVRPHQGQILVAGRLRNLLNYGGQPSQIMSSHARCGKVQDSYTMRCIPQIHGISHDTVKFVWNILRTECNSATDNPMIFPRLSAATPVFAPSLTASRSSNSLVTLSCTSCGTLTQHAVSEEKTDDAKVTADNATESSHEQVDVSRNVLGEVHTLGDDDMGVIISGGNFHGEYPAKALDYLAIGIHEIASVSERRIERLVNPALSHLPAFLVPQGGLNSGFMIAHCTAASLVSENKVLCHPSSVDSLSTSAAQEDHVSMGGMSARKALSVVQNVEYVLAIELLAACQALDFSAPLTSTAPLEAVRALVRSVVSSWDVDRYMAPDIEACVQLLAQNKVWDAVKDFVEPAYHDLPDM
eukprot:TRINITY_DN1727_c0_g1_i1.p1 TRINITY_DN1727_c0_g1~~TRINITY_DN1727_c0_g1_i1.p1  ORF type:complete len:603 (+),score=194.26 TRINITY_DN1727_c0_g1_i1:68-1876(+)